MSTIRERAREKFPMVLLTLLSIVQALALELLWSHVVVSDLPLPSNLPTLIAWIQVIVTLIGIMLIWVVYASAMMRFRWVPVFADSMYPFIIGVLEFIVVESLSSGSVGSWMLLMAIVFAVTMRMSHASMKRARRDGGNDAFFSRFKPATPKDFIPETIVFALMVLTGVAVLRVGQNGLVAFLGVTGCLLFFIFQFYLARKFWMESICSDDAAPADNPEKSD